MRLSGIRIGGAILLAALAPLAVSAQTEEAEENPETEASEEVDGAAELVEKPVWRERWDLGAELSFTNQSGNSDLRVFSGAFQAKHLDRDRYRLDLSVESRYGRSGDEVVARRHEGSLAFDLWPQRRFTPSIFTNATRDPIRRLDLRLASGIGVKVTAERPRRSPETSISVSLLHDYDRVRGSDPDDPVIDRHRARWQLQARGGQRVTDDMTLQHRSSFQPVWGDFGDYLIRTNTGARTSITDRLSLAITYRYDRNARPPDEVRPDDHIFQTGISIDL